MAMDPIELETTAMDAYKRAVAAMREVLVAYGNAGMTVPDRVRRFFDDDAKSKEQKEPQIIIPAPPSPQRPPQARPDWMWLPIDEVQPTTLVRAVLRAANEPLQPRVVVSRINELRSPDKHASNGTVANIGTRLFNEGVITRGDAGWAIAPEAVAPVILDGHAWGPASAFQEYDLAAHRRNGIVHVLKLHKDDGLQIVQITKRLTGLDWLHAPVSTDVVKTDLQTLEAEQRAKRVGNSGKWRAIMTG